MHAELLVGIAEAGRLAVVLANLPEGSTGSEGAGDVGSGSLAGRDGDGAGGNLELGLVEDHGVGAGLHQGGGEGTGGRGVGPVLGVGVVPVNNTLEAAGDAGSGAGDGAAAGGSDVTLEAELAEEVIVEVGVLGDARAGEGLDVRAVQTHTVGLGLGVVAVHVVVQVGRVTGVVGVNVAEEGTAGRELETSLGLDRDTDVNLLGAGAVDTADLVIDEALAGVELGSGLAADDEDIGALDGGAGAGCGGNNTEGVFAGEGVLVQTRDPAELANVWLCGDVGRHVDVGLALLDNEVVCKSRGGAGHLDDLTGAGRDSGGLDGGGSETRADVAALAGILELVPTVLDGVDITAGLGNLEDESVG